MGAEQQSNAFLERLQKLSPKRLALLAAELERRLAVLENPVSEPIAVIGLACRMPGGAANSEEFWNLLAERRDAIETVPPDRWDAEALYDPNPDAPGKIVTKAGGFVRQIADFDPIFFGISPREALGMDPQQRILLEIAWEALEDAGEPADSLFESATGVYVGISTSDYASRFGPQSDIPFSAYSGTGVAHSTAAGRLSYFFGLKGPNLALDTSCSSSAVAIHLACQSLRSGECQRALAGGVNAILGAAVTVMLSQAHMLAGDGRCKTFSRAADGFVRSEGCGMLVLKRLADAQASGDRILGVIRASAINHDGRSNGLTAPSGSSQEAVIEAALAQARLHPSDIDYVETHGTGTVLGDAIELGALANVFGKDRTGKPRLVLGAVKTNVGHLEAAAGVTGVIKVLQSLAQERIPANLHLARGDENEALEPRIFKAPRETMAWPRRDRPRFAGVSSFGFSGTNAHIILEEAPVTAALPAQPATEMEMEVLAVSAKTPAALSQLCLSYAEFLRRRPQTLLRDFVYTANACRSHFQHRVGLLVRSVEDAAAQLEQLGRGRLEEAPAYRLVSRYEPPAIAFLFTGQGSQYAAMGREFYEGNSVFRDAIDGCGKILGDKLAYPPSAFITGATEIPPSLIDDTSWTQPVLFAFEYALARMWQSWGVEPGIVLGHSLGEYVAACLAGVFSLEAALTLAYERGRRMGELPRSGGMLAVRASEKAIFKAIGHLPAAVAVAAVNGPESVVLSGRSAEIAELNRSLEKAGIRAQPLTVSHAFHSPMMDPMLDAFEQRARELSYRKPEIPFVSNLTGKLFADEDTLDAGYWRRHVRSTVRFSDGLDALLEQEPAAFLEIGPHPVLLGMARFAYPDLRVPGLPALRRGRNGWQCAFEAMQQLYLLGVPIAWSAVYRDRAKRKLALPTYPFQRQRYWIAPQPVISKANNTETEPAPARPAFDSSLYQVQWFWKSDENGDLSRLTAGNGLQKDRSSARSKILIGNGARLAPARAAFREAGIPVTEVEIESGLNSWGARGQLSVLREQLRDGLSGSTPPDEIVLLVPDGSRGETCSVAALECSLLVLGLLQEVVESSSADTARRFPRVWVVTDGACMNDPSEEWNLAGTVAGAIVKTACLEYPAFSIHHVDLVRHATRQDFVDLVSLISQGARERTIALRGGLSGVPRLVPLRQGEGSRNARLAIHPQAAYLVTGGFSGLGLRTAQWLVERGAKEIHLAARRQPNEEVRQRIEAWQGAGVQVHAHQVDVSVPTEVESLFAAIAQSGSILRGIVHSAGVLDDGVMMQQNAERFARVFAPKVQGGWLLHEFSLPYPLDFFVCFGSAVAALGSGGQANYAAANGFLEGLAEMRRQMGLPATTIAWGPWSEVGLTAQTNLLKRFRSFGMEAISPEKGMALLEQALQTGSPVVVALPVDWSKFLAPQSPHHGSLLFEKVAPRPQPTSQTEPAGALASLLERSPAEARLDVIKDYVRGCVASLLLLESSYVLPEDQPFSELGLDSLMALQLKNHLQSASGGVLPSNFVFEYPTVRSVATYLNALTVQASGPENAMAADSGYEEIVL